MRQPRFRPGNPHCAPTEDARTVGSSHLVKVSAWLTAAGQRSFEVGLINHPLLPLLDCRDAEIVERDGTVAGRRLPGPAVGVLPSAGGSCWKRSTAWLIPLPRYGIDGSRCRALRPPGGRPAATRRRCPPWRDRLGRPCPKLSSATSRDTVKPMPAKRDIPNTSIHFRDRPRDALAAFVGSQVVPVIPAGLHSTNATMMPIATGSVRAGTG